MCYARLSALQDAEALPRMVRRRSRMYLARKLVRVSFPVSLQPLSIGVDKSRA